MKKWHVFLAVAVVAAIVAALFWRADATCHVPRHREALKVGTAAGCIEFWINRYQTAWSQLIAAGAALFAAILAWRSVQRQIGLQEVDLLRREIQQLTSEIRAEEQQRARVETAIDTVEEVQAAFDSTAKIGERYIETVRTLEERNSPIHPFYLTELLPALDRHIYRLPYAVSKTKRDGFNVMDVDAEIGNILDRIIGARPVLEAERSRCDAAVDHLTGELAKLRAGLQDRGER